jgi:hypothetical protein
LATPTDHLTSRIETVLCILRQVEFEESASLARSASGVHGVWQHRLRCINRIDIARIKRPAGLDEPERLDENNRDE